MCRYNWTGNVSTCEVCRGALTDPFLLSSLLPLSSYRLPEFLESKPCMHIPLSRSHNVLVSSYEHFRFKCVGWTLSHLNIITSKE